MTRASVAMRYLLGMVCACTIPAQIEAASPSRAAAIAQALPITQAAYQYLHANPETGKKEFKAHDYIANALKQLGFTQFLTVPALPTAVIAVFDTGRPGKTIALRSEMDARELEADPVTGAKGEEPASHSPRSALPGLMHNCGHDVHAAILLGVAAMVQRFPDHFSGKIVFLFQPAEETPGGADDIVKDGTLTRLGVQQIYAEHVAPGMPVGTIGMAPGANLAGSNYFTLTLVGRPSHAAQPQAGDDVALSAMKVAEELSYMPARSFDIASNPMVISITRFEADSGQPGGLPKAAEIKGTIRAFTDLTSAAPGAPSIEQVLLDRVTRLSATYGLTPSWNLHVGSPPTTNDPALFAADVGPLTAAFSGKIDRTVTKAMFSEDFAYYTPVVPALYVSLGVARDGLGSAGVHTPDFTISPDALPFGLEYMSMVAELGTTGQIDWR